MSKLRNSYSHVYHLVDDALRGVGEVSELRLPEHQRVGVGHGVAQLEPEDPVLGQRAVAHCVGRLQTRA